MGWRIEEIEVEIAWDEKGLNWKVTIRLGKKCIFVWENTNEELTGLGIWLNIKDKER